MYKNSIGEVDSSFLSDEEISKSEIQSVKDFVGSDFDTVETDFLSLDGKLRPQSQRDLRALAFSLLYAVDRHENNITVDAVADLYRKCFELELEQDSFALVLARGVSDEIVVLDDHIKPLLKNWKFERLGCCTRLILRMAIWELLQPNALASVVINEAIELSKAFAEKDAYKFINGILDEFCKIQQLKK